MRDGLAESLLAICLKRSNFREAISLGLHDEMLLDEARVVWGYCINIIREGGVPSLPEVCSRFKLSLDACPEDTVDSLVRRIRQRAYLTELKPIFERSLAFIKEARPEDAVETALKAARLKAKYSPRAMAGPLSYKSNFEERILMYKTVKDKEGLLGAWTRWPTLNNTIKGWQSGLMYVIAALSSLGKSWALMMICDDLLIQGRKPLIVSTEMDPVRLQFRLDCLRYKIPFPMLRDGTLSEEDEVKWMKTMFDDSGDLSSDAVFVGKNDAKSVTEVALLCKEYGATDVLIDGGYRLTRSREWGDQQKLIQDIQFSAENTGVPWIVTTQLGDSNETGKGFEKKVMSGWNVRYAKEWIIDPDVVIILAQDPDLKLIEQMNWIIWKLRDGDGPRVSFRSHWKPREMKYDEVTETEELEESLGSLLES